MDVSSRVRKPRRALLGEDSDVEVWLDDLWRPGKVRAVDLDAQLLGPVAPTYVWVLNSP